MRAALARDERVDFFRGLALIIIFVDHVPGNILSRLTPQNFGLSNAADMFVLLAGISAGLAYFPLISAQGYVAALVRLLRRSAQIYSAHVAVLWVSIAVLILAAQAFHRAEFMGHELPAWVPEHFWTAVKHSLALTLQPPYLDILPLYVVLLLTVPVFIYLERLHRGTGLAASIALWLIAELTGLNLPSSRSPAGWYFDPFAWQVLFCIGLLAGIAVIQDKQLPRSAWGIAGALCYAAAVLVLVTPCRLRSLSSMCAIAISPNHDVVDLTPWRILHVLCLAYLTAVIVPSQARWLSRPVAQLIVLLGRNSLPVFLTSVVLSLLGSIMLVETDAGWQKQVLLNGAGLWLLLVTAFWSDRRKGRRQSDEPRSAGPRATMTLRETGAVLLVLIILGGHALLASGPLVTWSLLGSNSLVTWQLIKIARNRRTVSFPLRIASRRMLHR